MLTRFKKCPSCGHRGGVKQIDTNEVTQDVETGDVEIASKPRPRMGNLSPVPSTTQERTMASGEDAEGVTYRCSDCGHEWTETITKKWRGQLPNDVDTSD
jgi:DNA-directed RNA polymerase subunit RPC12/RpoP